MVAVSAWVFVVVAAVVVAFQLALIAGAPWGHLTQGGEVKGSLPPMRRAAAGLSALLMVASAGIVLARAGVALPDWQGWVRGWVWSVVALSALTVAANAASRSRSERALWLPIGLALLATSLIVALRAG
jgi:hypothetical protein